MTEITDEWALGFFNEACEAYRVAYNTIANNEAKDLTERIATAKPSADQAAATLIKARVSALMAERDAEIARLHALLEWKVELAGLDGLIERLRNRAFRLATRDFNGDGAKLANEAAAKLEALRDCARELAGFVEHKPDCATWKRLYSEEIGSCTCGLDEALARFREVGEG